MRVTVIALSTFVAGGCILLVHDPEDGAGSTAAGGSTVGTGVTMPQSSSPSATGSSSTGAPLDCTDRLSGPGTPPGPVALKLTATGTAAKSNVYFTDLAVDGGGNVAFAGIFTDQLSSPKGVVVCPPDQACMFAGAFDPSGNLASFTPLGTTSVQPHVAFSQGNVVVAGNYTLWLPGGSVAGSPNGFVATFSVGGTFLARHDLAFGNVYVSSVAFAMDAAGNAYLGGALVSNTGVVSGCGTSAPLNGQQAFVASLDVAGACNGLQVWQTPGSQAVRSLGVGQDLVASGIFQGTLAPPGTTLLAGSLEAFLASGPLNGTPLPTWNQSVAVGQVGSATPEGTLLVSKDGSTVAGVVYGPDAFGLMPVAANADVVFFDRNLTFGRRIATQGIEYVFNVDVGTSATGAVADRPIALSGSVSGTSALDFGNGVMLAPDPAVGSGWMALFDGSGNACRALGIKTDDYGSIVTHVAVAPGSVVIATHTGEATGSSAALSAIAFGDLPKPL